MSNTDKREIILQAALELIAEHGFHGTPTAMIAKKAGVATGTIFCYFESKDVLINELFWEIKERITAVLQDGYMVEDSINKRFFHLVTGLLRYFITYPLDFRYLEQFLNSPYGVEYRRSKFFGTEGEPDIIKILFTDAVSKHAMKDLPLIVLFALTIGPLLALARDHVLGFIELDEHVIQLTTDACWDSVKL